jgi:hypothetical protein
MKNTLILVLILTMSLLYLSCDNGDDKSVSVGGNSEHYVNSYCSEVAKVVCENVFDCCTGQQIEDQFGLSITTSKSKCLRDADLMCKESNPALIHSMKKGTVTVNSESANECLRSLIVDDTCFLLTAEAPIAEQCETDIFSGTQGIGKECVYDIECQGAAYCGSDRKCKALPVQEQPCDAMAPTPCAVDLFCDQDNTCQPLKKGGEDCDAISKCSEQLFCDDDPDDGDNVCKSRKAIGAACEDNFECLSIYCIPGLCADGWECYKDSDCVGTCADTGDDCNSDEDCPGTCQETGDPCQADWDCFGVDDKCVHPNCQSSCIGNPVCGENYFTFDYCELGLGLIGGIQ